MKKTNYIFNAKVINVVDGDTIDVSIDLGFSIHSHQRVRLAGIDTAELNSPDSEKRGLAQRAKLYLQNSILDRDVVIETYKVDKYGRYLADVFLNGECTNQKLLDENLAVYYDGGKRNV